MYNLSAMDYSYKNAEKQNQEKSFNDFSMLYIVKDRSVSRTTIPKQIQLKFESSKVRQFPINYIFSHTAYDPR